MDRHDRKLKPSAQALQKGYFMHRFTFLAGIALLCVPVHAAGKPKPPSITVGSGAVCLDGLRLVRPEISSLPSISGLLINNSTASSTVSLEFNLISGRVLAGTALAFFSGEISPGASWRFIAYFSEYESNRLVTRTESESFEGVATLQVGSQRFSILPKFDPVFNLWNRQERKEWELIHGKYDQ
jgi:hypothetical protein